ncbi:HEAT repeat domain-containing protein [Actinoplanes sp. NPDC004185]
MRRFANGRRTPIAIAFAALHRDGRIREGAVAALAARPFPEMVAPLVLRADDWAAQVRNPARAALTRLLSDDPGRFLPGAVPMAVKLADRYRGRFALSLVTAAVLAAPDDVRRQLAASPGLDLRRLAFDADLHQGRLDLPALADLAVRESDARIRNRAAQAAYEQAVVRQHRPTLERLFSARPAGVRALGLTGLLRLGPATEAVAALDDPAPLVRAIARDAARRAGTDVVAHYRTAEPSPGSVAGLAEAGSDRDAPVLIALLSHPSGRIRAAAVRALGHLGAVPVELVVPLVRDPAAAVVREAALALRPFDRRLPPGLGWELLGDSRPEVRRAGYRLLNDRDPETRRKAALRLAVDPDPRLAARGRADVTR